MLFRKTRSNQRDRYVYRFCDGTTSVVEPGTDMEVMIKTLHALDDHEVYNNIKNSRPPVEDWQKPAIRRWKELHPEEEAPKNWNLSLDGPECIADPGSGRSMKEISEKASETDPLKELLYAVLSEFPEEDRRLYRMYYVAGFSQQEIAEVLGISQNSVSKRIRRLAGELKERCRKNL